MPKMQEVKLEIIRHIDGRYWVRKDGVIITDGAGEVDYTKLVAMYRKIGGTIIKTQEMIVAALANPIIMSHPQFVRPHERDSDGYMRPYRAPKP